MEVVQHDSLERFEEHLLIVEVLTLVLLKELVRELSQGVNSVDHDVEILVASDPGKVITKHLPD